GYARFDRMNLAGIDRVQFLAGSADGAVGTFELRADSPTGPLVAAISVDERPGYRPMASSVKDPGGVHDLYVVSNQATAGRGTISLIGLEFLDSPAAAAVRAKANAAAARRIAEHAKAFKARPFVREWKMDDLAGSLSELDKGRSFDRGKTLFQAASCITC